MSNLVDDPLEKFLEDTRLDVFEPKELKDPFSTGRKEAAKLYPIDSEKDCEWKGLKNCGGGKFPVVGCISGKQKDRHHGDKCTLHNCKEERCTNVHLICSKCHQRWHHLNDRNPVTHKPEAATMDELMQNEIDWNKKGHVKSVTGTSKRD